MPYKYIVASDQLQEFIDRIYNLSKYRLDYDPIMNKIQLIDQYDKIYANIRLPWIIPPYNTINELVKNIRKEHIQHIKYLIILIQAGYSAICQCKNGQILEHKLIRKYMVRKKQGKAQITFLHKKGKSRAGSRIRLTQTVHFFEEINEQINMWLMNEHPDRLLMSCPPRLWGLLFQTKVKPEYSKKDNRIFKIPIDIKIADNNELVRVNIMAQKCSIEFYDEPDQEWLNRIVLNN